MYRKHKACSEIHNINRSGKSDKCTIDTVCFMEKDLTDCKA